MKLRLKANPTFDAAVPIPVLGGDPVEVTFTFKHRTLDDYNKLVDDSKAWDSAMSDQDIVMLLASGWKLTDKFSAENVRLLCQHYPGAGPAVWRAYSSAYIKARLGN